jgi:hypothetical protein
MYFRRLKMEETKQSLSWKIVDSIIVVQILDFCRQKCNFCLSFKIAKNLRFFVAFYCFCDKPKPDAQALTWNVTWDVMHDITHDAMHKSSFRLCHEHITLSVGLSSLKLWHVSSPIRCHIDCNISLTFSKVSAQVLTFATLNVSWIIP